MKKVIFILGPARSGKSSYAVRLAKKLGRRIAFIATARALDEEMKKRISKHKRSRPAGWKTIEEPVDITGALRKLNNRYNPVLIDCMGFLVSNLLEADFTNNQVLRKIKELLSITEKNKSNVIIVSNEVGGGIVPDNPLARRFRDILGSANQMVAEKANEVIVMQAGIPMTIGR